jgi:hypothetical protein
MPMLFTLIALALSGPPATQPATPAPTNLLSVRVDTPASADANAKALARELRAAVVARKAELRPAKEGETPGLVVRIERAQKGQDGKSTMGGSLARGQAVRPFTLSYAGDFKALAAALARNMKRFADQFDAAGQPAK